MINIIRHNKTVSRLSRLSRLSQLYQPNHSLSKNRATNTIINKQLERNLSITFCKLNLRPSPSTRGRQVFSSANSYDTIRVNRTVLVAHDSWPAMAESTAMELDPAPVPTPTVFRPNKKRNYIRRARATSTDLDPPTIAVSRATINTSTTYIPSSISTTTATTSLPPIQSASDSEPSAPSNLASILALRKKQSRPKRGLDIAELVPKVASTDPASETPHPEDEEARDTAEQELAAVVNRFTHQTGQVLDVDKHMYAFPPPPFFPLGNILPIPGTVII